MFTPQRKLEHGMSLCLLSIDMLRFISLLIHKHKVIYQAVKAKEIDAHYKNKHYRCPIVAGKYGDRNGILPLDRKKSMLVW